MANFEHVAVRGDGVIRSSWAALFLAAELHVNVFRDRAGAFFVGSV
ncbi:MAG: hypothetical protein KDJ65_17140 [Anaerolineae bacterium]|nr:hypothetical protein [Anaerolineae bacterium]